MSEKLILKSNEYDFEDAYNRYGVFKKKENRIPSEWTFYPHKKDAKPTVTPKQSTPKVVNKIEQTSFNFNQRNYPKPYSAYVCGLTAFANALSVFDLIKEKDFNKTVKELIPYCKTTVGAGTVPANFVYGCNKYLAKHKMAYEFVTRPFKRATFLSDYYNIIKAGAVACINFRTDTSIGYKDKMTSSASFGHYSMLTGANKDTKQVKFVDSNRLGTGYVPKWYNADTIARLIEYNGNRPFFVLKKK